MQTEMLAVNELKQCKRSSTWVWKESPQKEAVRKHWSMYNKGKPIRNRTGLCNGFDILPSNPATSISQFGIYTISGELRALRRKMHYYDWTKIIITNHRWRIKWTFIGKLYGPLCIWIEWKSSTSFLPTALSLHLFSLWPVFHLGLIHFVSFFLAISPFISFSFPWEHLSYYISFFAVISHPSLYPSSSHRHRIRSMVIVTIRIDSEQKKDCD